MKTLSLVLFSYNRPGYLRETLRCFFDGCMFPREQIELIISDDGSDIRHLSVLPAIAAEFRADRLLSSRHGGLGYNQNQGLSAATGLYVFHLQDDFALMDSAKGVDLVRIGISLLEKHADVDLVRYCHISRYDGIEEPLEVIAGIPVKRLYGGPFTYSDNPHLKRRSFHAKFGLFQERGYSARQCELTEYKFSVRCNKLGIKAAWLSGCFEHIGQTSVIGHKWKWECNRTVPHWYVPSGTVTTLRHEDAQIAARTAQSLCRCAARLANRPGVIDINASEIPQDYLFLGLMDTAASMHTWIESLAQAGLLYDARMTGELVQKIGSNTSVDPRSLWDRLAIFGKTTQRAALPRPLQWIPRIVRRTIGR